jgi:hypothetical protein
MRQELAVLVTDVNAAEGERVQVRIDRQRAFPALDDRTRTGEGVLDAA